MAFPSLSRNPISVSRQREDNTIRVDFDGGYQHRRPRYTREVYNFSVVYDYLPAADITLIENHLTSVGLSTSFSWDDENDNTHTVIYDEYPKWEEFIPGWYKIDAIKLRGV